MKKTGSIVCFLYLAMITWSTMASVRTVTSRDGELGDHVRQPATTSARIVTRDLSSKKWVSYRDFGAKGDGKTDDMKAIAAAHAFANEHGLPVKADKGATYYIGRGDHTVEIQTSTDFGNAAFIIDDTEVKNRNSSVFHVSSSLKPVTLNGVATLRKNQAIIDVPLPGSGLITVTNANARRYIRYGPNQSDGSSQTDIFLVNNEGVVDKNTPIIWDFDQVTEMTFLPIDEDTLTITGGHFTTIANREESHYNYYSRGMVIQRSNVVIDGLEHHVTDEGETGAPYSGFIIIGNCSNVTVKNCILTGHKTYRTIGSAGVPVAMGSYDISVGRALNVTFENCSQTNDIYDPTYWGIMGSNYCKNLVYDCCTFSRFDAHMGVANATIRNSTLGHQGINAIGSGVLIVENSTVKRGSLINLRDDYGSTWQGELIIRDCVFIPTGASLGRVNLIGGSYSGQHDFGYTCYMPERITIENLRIEDGEHPDGYKGPAIFANFNEEMNDDSYVEKYPYVKTKEVILKNVEAASDKPLRISDNEFMFKDVKVIYR
ncbi:MAG: right-handed parallel beta-helix repeat-containing protein [Fermentimonas sp.]